MKKLYCYSKNNFDCVMSCCGFFSPEDVPDDTAIISICSQWNEHEEHWFSSNGKNVLNIDFDDTSPTYFWDGNDYYDEAQVSDNQEKYFNLYDDSSGNLITHTLDYKESRRIVKFIEEHRNCNFYIHCSAGISRSQGVVRYMLDVYPNEFETNPQNPCIAPNRHVTMILKRVYRELYDSLFTDESCNWDRSYEPKVRINFVNDNNV